MRQAEREQIDAPRRPRAPDHGTTFVELLVAIVLIGTVIVATLAGLRATIIGTTLDRDHANAHAWLQSATDLLYGEPRRDCGAAAGDIDQNGTDEADNIERAAVRAVILGAYQAVVAGVSNPEGWPASNITVYDVLYWDGDSYQPTCYDDFGINLQLIKLRVRDLDNKIVEEVEVVKGA